MPYPEEKPATARMLGIKPDAECYPSIVVSQGRVLENNLKWLGLDKSWLDKELKGAELKSIYLMIADSAGRTYTAAKEDLHEP